MESKLKICLSGHTNTGKTTLFRILTKNRIGDVDDRSGVTTKNMSDEPIGLSVSITDTPGFENAGTVKFIMEKYGYENGLIELQKEKLHKEIEIIKALIDSDVVYYLVSVESVLEDSHTKEIELIKQFSKNIIGVINKYNVVEPGEILNGRKQKVENFFNKHHIQFVEYDLYWDTPEKEIELLDKSILFLDDEKKQKEVKEQIDIIKAQNITNREEIADEVVELLNNYRKLAYTNITSDYNYKFNETEKRKLINQISYIEIQFIDKISQRYGIVFNEKMPEFNKLLVEKYTSEIIQSAASKRMEATAEQAAGGGIVGGGFGFLSGVITALQLGVTAATGGVALAIFAGGAALGAIGAGTHGALQKQTDTIKYNVGLSRTDEYTVTIQHIAAVWAIAYFGFEYSENKSNTKQTKIKNLIDDQIPNILKSKNINIDNFDQKDNIVAILNDLKV